MNGVRVLKKDNSEQLYRSSCAYSVHYSARSSKCVVPTAACSPMLLCRRIDCPIGQMNSSEWGLTAILSRLYRAS